MTWIWIVDYTFILQRYIILRQYKKNKTSGKCEKPSFVLTEEGWGGSRYNLVHIWTLPCWFGPWRRRSSGWGWRRQSLRIHCSCCGAAWTGRQGWWWRRRRSSSRSASTPPSAATCPISRGGSKLVLKDVEFSQFKKFNLNFWKTNQTYNISFIMPKKLVHNIFKVRLVLQVTHFDLS